MSGGQQVCDARRGTEGAIFVEFLIAFLPVLSTFLCLCQVALLFAVKLVVEHAAVNAARTAAVVIGDDPKTYGRGVEPLHQVKKKNGPRYLAIEHSAVVSLAPFIADGTILDVNVIFPAPNEPDGKDQGSPTWSPMADSTIDKVRVRVEATALCKVGLANRLICINALGVPSGPFGLLGMPSRTIRAEAVYPYQGASYEYP